eukprot:6111333-Ditylum_brightwellii.AAC.1
MSDKGKVLEAKQTELIRAQVNMVNYAIEHRYSYKRWKYIVNVIIPKELGNSKIHKICVIHIYEADYSAMTGINWCNLIKSSECRKTIHRAQVGGHTGHDANILTFLGEIEMILHNAAGSH